MSCQISIAMAYFNRKSLLLNTLKSIAETKFPKDDFEVVIVDDQSNEENRLIDIVNQFDFSINLIELHQIKRFWNRDVLPTNIAISRSLGKHIILQNPECLHIGDVISSTYSRLEAVNGYYSCKSLSVDKSLSDCISIDFANRQQIVKEVLTKNTANHKILWYNHPIANPRHYHFTCGMSKENFVRIGGFDLKFMLAGSYADNDFVRRVKLGKIEILTDSGLNDYDLMTVHQHHEKGDYVDSQPLKDGYKIFAKVLNNYVINPNLTYDGDYIKEIRLLQGFVE